MSENKVKLENTSPAAIVLPLLDKTPDNKLIFSQDTVTVPRLTVEEFEDAAGAKHQRKVFGVAEIAAEQWDRLKKDKVVMAYLESGRLRVAGSAGPPPAASPSPGGKASR
jgi:hypothetical protein